MAKRQNESVYGDVPSFAKCPRSTKSRCGCCRSPIVQPWASRRTREMPRSLFLAARCRSRYPLAEVSERSVGKVVGMGTGCIPVVGQLAHQPINQLIEPVQHHLALLVIPVVVIVVP